MSLVTYYLPLITYHRRRGIAVLPVMILIGAIIVEIAIVGGILAFYGSTSNLAIRASQEALFTARSGVEDALIKIVRNKGFTAATPYAVSVNSGIATTTASITVIVSSTNAAQKIIVATSSVMNRTKTVQAVVNIDSVSGKVDIVSFGEVTN